MQQKIAAESDLLSAGIPDQTIVLLCNTLAGITAMLNYSQVTRDLNNFTPFAFLKSAGYAIAGTLGISPRRKVGAQMMVNFVSGDGNIDFSNQITDPRYPLAIPPFTQFTCRNLIWHTRQGYSINSTDTSVDIQLFEGSLKSVSFISNGERFQRWLIGSPYNVDQNTIRVNIKNEFWIPVTGSFVKFQGSDKVFIPITSPDGRVLLLFGNGTYGSVPPAGETILLYYTLTVGVQGNSASVGDGVSIIDPVNILPGQALTIVGQTTTIAAGGADEEDLDSIKYVAPRLYAANERSVRRDDYIGQMLGSQCPVGMADARAWGEYEQARLVGLGTLDMMNRAFWGGVLDGLLAITDTNLAPSSGISPTNDFTLSRPLSIPGSVIITSNDVSKAEVTWRDQDGYGILTSPMVNRDYLAPVANAIVSSTTSDVGTTVSSLIDGSPDTAWQSVDIPTQLHPVLIMLALPAQQVPVSFRIRASDDLGLDDRAFPAGIAVWGSNKSDPPPVINKSDDWMPIRGTVNPPEPGIEGPSRWYSLNNTTAYYYLLFSISDRYGIRPYVKMSEIEVQMLPSSSTLDYATGNVHIDWGTSPDVNTTLTAQYYISDLTPNEQTDVQNFILDTNHFTTQFTYSTPRMVRADIIVRIYYNPSYGPNTVQNDVASSLQSLLKVKEGSISRTVKYADLAASILKVTGVDYFVFDSPPNGQDLICDIDQYVCLTSMNIQMLISDRMGG